MSFEFDASLISHVAVRLDGPFVKSFLDNLGDVSFQEAEGYLSKLIKGQFKEDDFNVGLRIKPDDYQYDQLFGYLYKNQAFQHVATEILNSDIESETITSEINDFLYTYASISELEHNVHLLDKKSYKLDKSLDTYIFKELVLQFTNNKNIQYRSDNEYFTIINRELSSKYIYFKDNRNATLCKFISKGMYPSYLDSFLEHMHSIKVDAEHFFYYALIHNLFSFNPDLNVLITEQKELLEKILKAYKTMFLKNLNFNLYEFLENDLDTALMNRIEKSWHYSHRVISSGREPENMLADTPWVVKLL